MQSKRKKLRKKATNRGAKTKRANHFHSIFPHDALLVLYNQRFSHHFHTQLTERERTRGQERGANREWELGKCLITSWAIRTHFEQISENENAWENGQVNTYVAHTHTHLYRHSHTASVIQFYLRVFWAEQRNTKTNDFLLSAMYKIHNHTHYRYYSYYINTIHNIQYTHTYTYTRIHMWFCGCGAAESSAYIFILCCELKLKLVMASLKEIINELVPKSHVCSYVCVCVCVPVWVSVSVCLSLLLLAHTCLRALFHLCKWIISWKQ